MSRDGTGAASNTHRHAHFSITGTGSGVSVPLPLVPILTPPPLPRAHFRPPISSTKSVSVLPALASVPSLGARTNGTNVACRVIDLSQSGAAIGVSSELRPPIGVVVTVGKTQGRVVRHIEDGFAIEFMRLQHPNFVEENVTGE